MLEEAIDLSLESPESTVQVTANTAEYYYDRANVKYYELQDVHSGLADYDRAIELSPDDADSYNNRAMLKYLELEDLVGAIEDMQIARSLYQQGNEARSMQAIELIARFQSKIDLKKE